MGASRREVSDLGAIVGVASGIFRTIPPDLAWHGGNKDETQQSSPSPCPTEAAPTLTATFIKHLLCARHLDFINILLCLIPTSLFGRHGYPGVTDEKPKTERLRYCFGTLSQAAEKLTVGPWSV